MVGDQTDRNILCRICLILCMCQLADAVAQRFQRIHIENGIHILYNNGQTLQAHTGIDILLFQLGIMVVAIILELGKYVVPYLHVPITVTANGTSRFAAAILLSAVIVNLRTRSAGACAMLPEVILLAEPENPVCRNADLLIPDIERLIIVLINRRIQTILVKAYHLGQKFPRPGNRLVFKIISEREVTKHLKKCTMTGCLADILDITGTNTLLTGRHTSSRRNLLSGEIWLQRSHTGIDQQQAVVIVRYKRKALHRQMSLALKEFQEHFSQFIYTVLFHVISSYIYRFIKNPYNLNYYKILGNLCQGIPAITSPAQGFCWKYCGQAEFFPAIGKPAEIPPSPPPGCVLLRTGNPAKAQRALFHPLSPR